MRYSSYSDYCDEAPDWLGAIPSHWKRMPLKRKFRIVNGSTPTSDPEYWDGEIVWITPTDFRNTEAGYFSTSSRRITLDGLNSCGTSLVPQNSIVITTRAPIGGVAQGKVEFCTNQGCKSLALDATDLHERFAFYVLDSSSPQLNALGLGSTFMELSTDNLGMYAFPVPTVPEQQQIAAFLDWKTGQIDALVARKKELLEKLTEKRIAVITQAVTQGLNPAAPMRDSRIPWLGRVPQHWKVLKMSWACTSIRDGTHNPPERAAGVHRLLSVRNVQGGRFALLGDDRTMTPEDFAELQRSYTVEEGDIVLAIVGATTGKSAIVGRLENVTVQRSLAILRPDRSAISSSFLHYVIQSPVVQTEIALTVFKYSAQPGIYLDDVGRLPVVRPPLTEQAAIVASLDTEIAKLEALAEKVESAIDCLTEYRTALVTAAATGKIDVRKVKIPGGKRD